VPPLQSPDRRTRRTRSALEQALLDLIAERDLAQISVLDVARLADVNRTTFYQHYTDVHDLAARACTAMFDGLVASLPVLAPSRVPARQARQQDAMIRVLAHIGGQARLYRALLGDDGSARVINHLHRRLTVALHVNLTRPESGTHADDPADAPGDLRAASFAGVMLGVILDWLHRGCAESPEQICAALWPHLPGN
jgi:AcrR family transcriptional regulator